MQYALSLVIYPVRVVEIRSVRLFTLLPLHTKRYNHSESIFGSLFIIMSVSPVAVSR
jgi:hypothetical protein